MRLKQNNNQTESLESASVNKLFGEVTAQKKHRSELDLAIEAVIQYVLSYTRFLEI